MTAARVAFATPAGPVVVSVGVPAAEEVAASLFPDDRTAPPPGPPWLTLDSDGDGFVLEAPGQSWRSPELAPLLVRLELALAEELVRRSGLLGLHAGGVLLGDGACLFPGEGGTGKSSLVAALASRGCPVFGDDVVLLDPRGRVHPFRRLMKVEEPARTLLGLPAPRGPLGRAWPDATFLRPRELGAGWAGPSPVRRVVMLGRAEREDTPVRLRPSTAGAVLPGLTAGLVLRDRVGPGDFEVVVEALQDAECLELRYGATAEAADALLALA